MNYIVHILIMINIYLILSVSLNLIVGYTGLLSVAHAAFYGVGAYVVALLTTEMDFNFFIAMVVAISAGMAISLVVAVPILRLKGDYFVLTTIAFQIIVSMILNNWVGVTGGPYGISGIPAPSLQGMRFDSLPLYFLFSSFITLCILFVFKRLYTSPFGRALKAIRDDEIAAMAIGKNVVALKTWAFVLGCGAASVAGGLFAGYVSYVDPTSFGLTESIFILCIVLVGGSGNISGPVIGSVIMVLLPEALRLLGVPSAMAANAKQAIFGLMLILLMKYRPKGIAGEYGLE